MNYNIISMINRLPQLKQGHAENMSVVSDQELQDQISNSYQAEQQQGIDDDFIQDIKTVRQMITVINNNNYRIQSIKGKYSKAIKTANQKANEEEMNEILAQNSKMQNKISARLKKIQQRVNEAEKDKKQKDEPETRMKRNFYISLSKEVSDVLKKQQENEEEYKNTVKNKITRQMKLVDRGITDQELQEYVKNPELAQRHIEQQIMGQTSNTLINAVSDIQDKFNDIKKLECSVQQCMALFNELSALVQAQGEKIDNIAANVSDCKDYVAKGEKKLQKAKEHHKCSKKCMCISIVVGAVILIIVIIIVVVTSK